MVSIAAFQAVDPDSIPGDCIYFNEKSIGLIFIRRKIRHLPRSEMFIFTPFAFCTKSQI